MSAEHVNDLILIKEHVAFSQKWKMARSVRTILLIKKLFFLFCLNYPEIIPAFF
jgi:hypothetical protein